MSGTTARGERVARAALTDIVRRFGDRTPGQRDLETAWREACMELGEFELVSEADQWAVEIRPFIHLAMASMAMRLEAEEKWAQ